RGRTNRAFISALAPPRGRMRNTSTYTPPRGTSASKAVRPVLAQLEVVAEWAEPSSTGPVSEGLQPPGRPRNVAGHAHGKRAPRGAPAEATGVKTSTQSKIAKRTRTPNVRVVTTKRSDLWASRVRPSGSDPLL